MYTCAVLTPPPKKIAKRKPADPFASREAGKYGSPIASREFILSELEEIGEPSTLQQLAFHFNLDTEEEIEALRRRLNAMTRDGQLINNRKGAFGLTNHMDLVKGTVQGNKDGAGYFIPDSGAEDMFLPLREMSRLFDGDKVLARFTGFDGRGRREAAVVEILQRRYNEIVGRFYSEPDFGVLVADNKRIQHEILIPKSQFNNAKDGQYVLAKIREYPSRRRKAIAEIVEVLGDVATPGIEIDVALHSFDIPHSWNAAVKKEVAKLPDEIDADELSHRHDLRHLPIVTIDGEDAKDFDDAVHAERNKKNGWTLTVAIADVSQYVTVGSALDEEADNRGTSVYFPGHVVPMLPEKLSNGLCSLKPNCDRLTMVCRLQISTEGEVTQFEFLESVIHSHARLTYNEAADMLRLPESEIETKLRNKLRSKYADVTDNLDCLYEVYQALRRARSKRGAMDFDSTETRMVFGADKKIREIVPVERNDAHRLIEECMLAANVAAAQLFESCEWPALYRVHEGPNPDKLEGLREFLGEMGLYLGGGEKPTPTDYQRTLSQIVDRPDKHMLQTVLIKSMMQAVYQAENTGHFGLGFPAYTHFTSPIRRYPDLLVHRAIRYLIRNKKNKQLKVHENQEPINKSAIYPYSEADLEKLGETCSAQERRADSASYSVIDWLKCEYMQSHIGEEFSGTIAAVTGFGLFVELDGIYIEGLVHITELSNDYYHFDPVRHCLEGERSRIIYRLGDVVEVKVARVDLEEKKIDLQMLGSNSQKSSGKRSKIRRTEENKGHKSKKKRHKGKSKSRVKDSKKSKSDSRKNKDKNRNKKAKKKPKKKTTGKSAKKVGKGKGSKSNRSNSNRNATKTKRQRK